MSDVPKNALEEVVRAFLDDEAREKELAATRRKWQEADRRLSADSNAAERLRKLVSELNQDLRAVSRDGLNVTIETMVASEFGAVPYTHLTLKVSRAL